MGVYSNGTFRVGGKTPANFSFNNAGGGAHFYQRARQMWNDQIDWEALRSKVSANVRGSQAEALEIKSLLLKLEEAINGADTEFSQEEVQALKDNIAQSSLAKTLLTYKTGKFAGAVGFSFENRINELIQLISADGASQDFRTGGKGYRVGSPIEFQLSKIASSDQIASLSLNSQGKLSTASADALWAIVKEDLRGDYRRLIGAYQYVIQQDQESGTIKDVIIRQVLVDRKIDIDVPSTLQINSQLSASMQRLGQLLVGRTFSLKNYNSFNQGSIHIGSANDFRRMSSFYYFATGNTNFADVCTFIFSSNNSKDQAVHRYIGWARILYELMGAGQLWDGSSGRLVDYIVINLYNSSGIGGLIINSTLEYLRGMPDSDPWVFFNSDNTFIGSQF